MDVTDGSVGRTEDGMRDFQVPGRSPAFAVNGMCATSHPLAATVAVRLLEDGGNAVDAAIAAAVLLGICEPQSTGIGGDCFVLLKPGGEDRIVALNGSGRAPRLQASGHLRELGHDAVPLNSADAVTVPGAVDAFCRLSADWGRLGLEASLAPAIRYADEGVPVAPRVAFDWSRAVDVLTGDAKRFYLLGGRAPEAGELFRAPGQAEVLRRIARHGRQAFYEGEVAEDMVDSLSRAGGTHTLDDFAGTGCTYGEPVEGRYGEYGIAEHASNAQGATALLLANILSCFDLASLDPQGVEKTHIEAEAAKLALDARDRFIGDATTSAELDHVLDSGTANRLAALIDPAKAMDRVAERTGAVHRDTVYLAVVDRDLMAVSLIYSVFHSFGSGLASSRFGINFHNRGSAFSLTEGHPNELVGGRRPLHTIIPAMLRWNGRVVMPFGVMGGQYQAVGHARVVSCMSDYGMNPQQALDSPRCFPEDGELQLERGYEAPVRKGLAELGHDVVTPETPHGGGQAILIDHESGVLMGASDQRKDGCALGY